MSDLLLEKLKIVHGAWEKDPYCVMSPEAVAEHLEEVMDDEISVEQFCEENNMCRECKSFKVDCRHRMAHQGEKRPLSGASS